MEKDPLRWHGGVKVSMAAALNDGLNGLASLLPQVKMSGPPNILKLIRSRFFNNEVLGI